jgi:hypothetical protein
MQRLYDIMLRNQEILNKHAVSVSDNQYRQSILDGKNSVLLKTKVVELVEKSSESFIEKIQESGCS